MNGGNLGVGHLELNVALDLTSGWFIGRSCGTSTATLDLCVAPLLGNRLEDFGRFVSNYVFAFRDRTNQSSKYRQSAQIQIGAAIINADLGVHFEDRLGGWKIANSKRSITSASDNAVCIFFAHRETSDWEVLCNIFSDYAIYAEER